MLNPFLSAYNAYLLHLFSQVSYVQGAGAIAGPWHERRQLTCRQACVGMSNAISDLTNVACRLDGIQVDDKGNESVVRVVGCGENA
jgi:hypothetical protein